ncbi:MAG: alpha/beta fold hydrolase [Ignavibacteriaceae bacterium]
MNLIYTRLQLIFLISLLFILFFCKDSYSNTKFSQYEVSFNSQSDGVMLSGTLTVPDVKIRVPVVVLIHGSGPENRDLEFGDHKLFKDLAEYLSSRGIAVLRYDKRGVGKSKGQFVPYDLDNYKLDGISAVEYLKTIKEIDKSKIGIIGISEGGIVVQMMANSCPDISFAILLGSPGVWGKDFFYSSQLAMTKAAGFNPNDINEMTVVFNRLWPLLTKDKLNSDEENQGKVLLKKLWDYIDLESKTDLGFTDSNVDFLFNLYRGDLIRKYYSYKPSEVLSQLKCSILALNGDKDVQTVSKINLTAIKEALKKGKCKKYKIMELKNHNHIFQICKTGKYSEYKKIKGTMSAESLSIIEKWINAITID